MSVRTRGRSLAEVAAELEALTHRVDRIEPFIYTAISAAAGLGLMVGIFARQFAHVLLGIP